MQSWSKWVRPLQRWAQGRTHSTAITPLPRCSWHPDLQKEEWSGGRKEAWEAGGAQWPSQASSVPIPG